MTTSVNDAVDIYLAAGGETQFAYTFPIITVTAPTLHPVKVETLTGTVTAILTEGVDFSVTGAGAPGGGQIVLDTGVFPSGAIAGVTWTISRVNPIDRITDFQTAGDFFASQINSQLDYVTQILQDQERDIDHAIKLPIRGSKKDIDFPLPGAGLPVRWNMAGTALESFTGDFNNSMFLQSGTGAVSRSVTSKIGELVSVKDFGAMGDGVTDDTAAIQATIDNGGSWWAPFGTYKISSNLNFPDNVSDIVVNAEQAIFDFTHATQDGITIHGAIRCRFYFGYIKTNSTGAAIKIAPVTNGYAENILTFRGLTGTTRKGIGLSILVNPEGASVSKFIGSDISEFDIGISVVVTGGTVNIDTMVYEFNFIRACNTSILESGSGGSTVNAATWRINFEASASGDIGLRTNAKNNKYEMTHFAASGGTLIQLDSGALDNTFDFVNPWTQLAFPGSIFVTNNSGNETNIFRPSRNLRNRIIETVDTTASGITLTAVGLVGGVYRRSGPAAPYSDTTDTAANIMAQLINPVVGTTFEVTIVNGTGLLQTILAGSGITLTGSNTVPASDNRRFIVRATNVSTPAFTFNGL